MGTAGMTPLGGGGVEWETESFQPVGDRFYSQTNRQLYLIGNDG